MAEPGPSSTAIPGTSEVLFFSSLHGERRRAERQIDRRDLQAAVRYGKKQLAKRDPETGAIRWKYTYADIIYITDETSTQEITSWVAPIGIPHAELTLKQIGEHEAAKQRLKNDPSLCTSHTVIVVDQSGSMRETDVADFYNRSQAVFGMLAMDFVAKPRLSGDATDTDVVSLVVMQGSADIAVEKEPMGLVLYNQFVNLHDTGAPQFHGNFLPALDIAEELLKSQAHGECALSLLFLSDGRPSDYSYANHVGITTSYPEVVETILGRVTNLAEVFGEQLSVVTLGFAGPEQDFTVLERMAEAARDGGSQGKFHRPELSSRGLGTAIADSISSLTATRLRLTTLAGGNNQRRELRQVEREAPGSHWGRAPTTAQTGDGWVVYSSSVEGYEFSLEAMKYSGTPWVPVELFSEKANGIAIRSKSLGQGAERLVFGLQEVDLRSGELVGPKLVAKESKHIGQETMKIQFHHSFAWTQLEAQRMAERFNHRVRFMLRVIFGDDCKHRVWDISFLPCSVYTFLEGGVNRSVLVEKLLVGRYTKFNGNNGYVHGGQGADPAGASAAEPAAGLMRARADEMMGAIDEEEEDSDSDGEVPIIRGGDEDDDEDDDGTSVGALAGEKAEGGPTSFDPEPESYVQAFSHFSYRKSRRKMLVCDLQGVQSTSCIHEDRAGVFELTDPVIHYRSASGRRQVYGRTDLGKKGMRKFFETHQCNDVCRLLGLASWESKGHVGGGVPG
ncbi:conserved unknown protein [Ectocarpus siliculosus]|uniref:Alpha-type protein kinase domain-containing protein n=1 Tax=Ectocarpus siliculosus TaxID=2880 RepID=D8LBU5_ECTSI|nr:conserved unknown protein [Ectocarpus siliculosus]|eukprot:CBN76804.1 conserved unknown protein [Ectocarpus siliculosus]